MNILVIGGKRGIGAAMAQQLLTNSHEVIISSRTFAELAESNENLWHVHCDVTDTQSMAQLAQQLETKFSHIDWLINCAGVLHNNSFMPEKALSQVNPEQLSFNYHVNAAGHLLLVQQLEKLITRAKTPVVTSLSARIGSIKDNHLGGWYAYRMSKAALNMGIRTLAIEWHRKHRKVKFLLLHPGTTDTDLSAPFQRNLPAGQLQSTELTASLLIKQIQNNQHHNSKYPLFLDHQGKVIPW